MMQKEETSQTTCKLGSASTIAEFVGFGQHYYWLGLMMEWERRAIGKFG